MLAPSTFFQKYPVFSRPLYAFDPPVKKGATPGHRGDGRPRKRFLKPLAPVLPARPSEPDILAFGLGVFLIPATGLWRALHLVLFFLAIGSSAYAVSQSRGGEELAQMVGTTLFCALLVVGMVYSLPPMLRWVALGVAASWAIYATGKRKGILLGRREALVPGVWVEITKPIVCSKISGGEPPFVNITLSTGIEAVIHRKNRDSFCLWIPDRYASRYGLDSPPLVYAVSNVAGLRVRTEESIAPEIVASVKEAMESWKRLGQGLPVLQ